MNLKLKQWLDEYNRLPKQYSGLPEELISRGYDITPWTLESPDPHEFEFNFAHFIDDDARYNFDMAGDGLPRIESRALDLMNAFGVDNIEYISNIEHHPGTKYSMPLDKKSLEQYYEPKPKPMKGDLNMSKNIQNENNLGRVDLLQPEKEKLKNIWSSKLSPMLNNVGGYIKANPLMSAGLGVTGAMNLGGLFDNDKIGGQLIGGTGAGLAGHYLLPKLLGSAVSPQAQVLMGLSGGALGSLFDKLRQNKEEQYQAQMQ